MKKTPNILIAFMRPYPPKRLTEIKVYLPFMIEKYKQVKLFALTNHKNYENVISADISEDKTNLLTREFLYNVKLIKYLLTKRNSITHLYVFGALFFGLPAMLLAKMMGVKVICDFRSIPVFQDCNNFKFKILIFIEKINFFFADQIVAINLVLLEKMYGRRYLQKAVELPEGYVKHTSHQCGMDGISSKVSFVLPTTLDKTRNLPAVISAFKGVEHCHLYLFGDGPELQELKDRFGSWSNVHLMGYCPYDELMKHLPEYDYGIAFIPKIPQFEYQPPLKTIEYLGAGLPVIATKTFGNLIYVNEENGILIGDDTESLRNVLSVIDTYKFDRLKVRESVEKYAWDNLLNEVFPQVFC